jgi:hypothetical protein
MDLTTKARSLVWTKDFSFSLHVQISSEAYPAFCPVDTGVLSPGVKHGWGVTLTTSPPSSAKVKCVGAIPLLPLSTSIACSRAALYFMGEKEVQTYHLNSGKHFQEFVSLCPAEVHIL